MTALQRDSRPPGWLRNLMRVIALGLGAAHTTVAVLKQSMNEDGIDYLDMGDAFLRGDWEMAVNGIWSPLYSWILGAVNLIVQPSIPWQFPTVQITNFFIYAIALFCFEYFWREFSKTIAISDRPGQTRIHPALWQMLGYSLFIWSSLNLIEIWAVNPDMCVAALVYIAAGHFLRLWRFPASKSIALRLGIILGLAYLAKAAMMPLAIVLIVLTAFIPPATLGRFRRCLLISVSFLVVAGPFLTALSVQYGKPTFSDVARFTYLKHVNEMPYPNFHGALDRLAGTPVHPPRRIFDHPPVYEFAEPVGGTYPMSYDPSYWTEGLKPTVTWKQQARALMTQGMIYFELFFRTQGAFTAIVLLLVISSLSAARPVMATTSGLLLSLWAVSCFGLYSLVHVTARYIAPFVVLFWAGLLGLVRLPDGSGMRRMINSGGTLLVVFVWMNIVALNLEGVAGMAGFTPLSESGHTASQFSDGHHADHPAIAEALLSQGLDRGDRVGFIGYSFSAYWARLARLQIVAEIHPEDVAAFWKADAERRDDVLQAFADAGVSAVVSEPAAMDALPSGWEKMGNSGYLLYKFP